MGNHIVIEPASKIREIARNALAGYWKPVILGVVIYYLLTSGVEIVLNNFFAFTNPIDLYGQSIVQKLPYGGGIYQLIIGGPLELGFTIFLLTFFRKRKIDNTLLFEGFSRFGKALLLLVLMSVKIMLWSFLFVIPGIIAAFRYSQAFYVLADNPDMPVSQCIKESCRIMAGNKGRYFYLQLTFIGWYILANIPSGIFSSLIDGNGAFAIVMAILLSLPVVVVDAYMMVSVTAFYELATERLVVMSSTDYDNMVNADYTVEEENAPAYTPDGAEVESAPVENPEPAETAETVEAAETAGHQDAPAEAEVPTEAKTPETEDNASAVNPEAEPEKPAEAAPDEQEQAPEERQE